MKGIYIFGAGKNAIAIVEKLRNMSYIKVLGIIDNDFRKWNTDLCGIKIMPPSAILEKKFYGIVISSERYFKDIFIQLIGMGVSICNILLYENLKYVHKMNDLPRHNNIKLLSTEYKRYRAGSLPEVYVVFHNNISYKHFSINNLCGYEKIFAGDMLADYAKKNGYLCDSIGLDNISELNALLNECTVLYWLWKNVKSDIVGIGQYRRYWVKSYECEKNIKNIVTNVELKRYLDEYDIIVTEPLMGKTYNWAYKMMYMSISGEAFQKGWNIVSGLIEERHPEYAQYFYLTMHGYVFFPCNMFAARKEIFDEYCEWLFSFIVDAAKRIDVSNYDDYSKRVIGFFAERMLTVWLMAHNYKIKTLPMVLLDDSELVEEQKCDE